MRTVAITILLALMMLALALAGCGARKPALTSPAPSAGTQAAGETGAAAQLGPDGLSGAVVSGIRQVRITAHRYAYVPNRIVVRKGEEVVILATSTDVTHGFAIDSFHINQKIEPKKTTRIEFTPGEAGDFTFYCGPGHKGMKGTLVVKP